MLRELKLRTFKDSINDQDISNWDVKNVNDYDSFDYGIDTSKNTNYRAPNFP